MDEQERMVGQDRTGQDRKENSIYYNGCVVNTVEWVLCVFMYVCMYV
jgi:hypothetical protein